MISPVVLTLAAACVLIHSVAYSDTVVSVRDGAWHDPATWETGTIPALTDEVVVSHQVSVRAGLSASVTSLLISGHLVLETGVVFQLSGNGNHTMIVTGVLECADSSLLSGTSTLNARFEGGSRYIHRQGPLGFIPLATWHPESILQISGFLDDGYINLAHSNSWRQSFGNVEYDCPAQTVFVVDLNGNLRDIRGNLTIKNTNGKALRLSTTQQATINIGGNLIIEGPTQVWFSTHSAQTTINIGGDFLYRSQASAASYLATRGNVRLAIGGDWILDAQGVLRMASSAPDSIGSRQATVSLKGDFRILRGGLVAPPPGSGRGLIEFNGTSPQHVEVRQVGSPLAGNLSYVISAGSRVDLGESALYSDLGSLEVSGTLEVGSADSRGAVQLGAAGGNIRIPGTRTFHPGSSIIYNGSAQQVLGNGHPAVPRTVLDNDAGIVQSDDVEIKGDLLMVRGSLTQGGHRLTTEGNITVSTGLSIQNLRLAGPANQTIDANGATLERLEIVKASGVAELISPLFLSGSLQIGSSGTAFRSQGFLTLLSTSDDAGHTASIGAIPAGSSVVGNVTVQRFMSGEGRLYRYLSSPVADASVASLMDDFPVTGRFTDPSTGTGIASASPSLFEYDESTGEGQQGWRGYPRAGLAADAPLQKGRGYAAFVRNRTSTLLDFTGTVNQGEIHLDLSYTEHNGTGNGWHLVGNPYPSAIDWDARSIDKTGISHVIAIKDNGIRRFRYWDGDSQYPDVPEGRIASGQSFWVRATSRGASLTFREEAKAVDASFYRRPLTSIPSLRISVSNGKISDQAILKLRSRSRDAIDEWDGLKLLNDTLNLSTMAGGTRMAIDSRPALPDSINLRMTDLPPARYVLRLSAQDSLRLRTYHIRDSYLKRTYKLGVDDSLEFLVTTDTASSRAGRFTLYLADLSSATPDLASVFDLRFASPLEDSMRVWTGMPFSLIEDLRLYPNPTSSELIVEGIELLVEGKNETTGKSQAAGCWQVALYDAAGTRVAPEAFRIRWESHSHTDQFHERFVRFVVETERLPLGTYFVRVADSSQRRSSWGRFVKI